MLEQIFYSLLLLIPLLLAIGLFLIINKFNLLKNKYIRFLILSLNIIIIYNFIFPTNYLYWSFDFLNILFWFFLTLFIWKPVFNEILISFNLIEDNKQTDKLENKYNMITLYYVSLILLTISHIFYYTWFLSFTNLPNIYEVIYHWFLYFPLYLTFLFYWNDIFDDSILTKKQILISSNIFILLIFLWNIFLWNFLNIYFPSLFNIPLFILWIILLILNIFYSIVLTIKSNIKERLIYFIFNIIILLLIFLV